MRVFTDNGIPFVEWDCGCVEQITLSGGTCSCGTTSWYPSDYQATPCDRLSDELQVATWQFVEVDNR